MSPQQQASSLSSSSFITISDVMQRLNANIHSILDDNNCAVPSTETTVDATDSTDPHHHHHHRQYDPGTATSSSSSNNRHRSGFELHTRLPDGSARPATENEIGTANFQMKLQQTVTLLQSLPNLDAQLSWAEEQRVQVGNLFYQKEQYENAMDIYLTCLTVATTKSSTVTSSAMSCRNNSDTNAAVNATIQQQQQQLVLFTKLMNNLALCTLRLQCYQKTITFCTMAMDHLSAVSCAGMFATGNTQVGAVTTLTNTGTDCGTPTNTYDQSDDFCMVVTEQRMKLHYKRSKAFRLKGEYDLAQSDIHHLQQELDTLYILDNDNNNNGNSDITPSSVCSFDKIQLKSTICKEEQLLHRAIMQGKKLYNQQQKAMQLLLNCNVVHDSNDNDNDTDTISKVTINDHNTDMQSKQDMITPLYSDMNDRNTNHHGRSKRIYSTLRATEKVTKQSPVALHKQQQYESTRSILMVLLQLWMDFWYWLYDYIFSWKSGGSRRAEQKVS
jgi:tetratricopeptide (TPR) repeat protein